MADFLNEVLAAYKGETSPVFELTEIDTNEYTITLKNTISVAGTPFALTTIASQAEALAGTDNDLLVTPYGLAGTKVIGYTNLAAFPATGVTDTIYIAEDTDYLYRWDGSTYAQVGGSSGGGGSTDGWLEITDTLTYSSVDDPVGLVTISGDVTDIYSLGMKLKVTNNSNLIYGIIVKISYSSPNTTITFLHEMGNSGNYMDTTEMIADQASQVSGARYQAGSDTYTYDGTTAGDITDYTLTTMALYLLDNSTISNVYYSYSKAPYGFPMVSDSWQVKYTDTTLFEQSSPVTSTHYNVTSGSIPIGVWTIYGKGETYASKSSSGCGVQLVLSTSSSSASDGDLISRIVGYNSTESVLTVEKVISLTTKATYYINILTAIGSITTLRCRGDISTTIIRATCAYL